MSGIVWKSRVCFSTPYRKGIMGMDSKLDPTKNPAEFNAAVKDYWEKPTTVSIIDVNLHQIEIEHAMRHLEPSDSVADIGCGNGEATVEYAKKCKSVVGIERSSNLRNIAIENGKKAGLKNLTHRDGDILKLGKKDGPFDAIVTQRLLINLASWEEMQQGLSNIFDMLKPGGRYVMI